ncbi:MAG: hypothetical protein WD737_00540 [Gemmatimonadota bacterium]
MATMNFSVPDDVKRAFNEKFGDRNKSAIIAGLMVRAIEEEEGRERRAQAIRRLAGRRSMRPEISDRQIRTVRETQRE